MLVVFGQVISKERIWARSLIEAGVEVVLYVGYSKGERVLKRSRQAFGCAWLVRGWKQESEL